MVVQYIRVKLANEEVLYPLSNAVGKVMQMWISLQGSFTHADGGIVKPGS